MKKSFRIVTALVLILSMFALNVGAMTVGTAAEAADQGAGVVCVLSTNLETAIDATGFNYLHAWIYFSNAAVISSTKGNSQLEITSSGTCDQNELSWNMKDRTYTDGWNEFYLPMSEATVDGEGECDLSAINFIRFYTFVEDAVEGSTDVKFGNIEFVNEAPLAGSVNVDMTGATNTTENGGSYICEQTSSDLAIFQKNFDTPFSIADYANGFLRINLYTTNAAAITGNAQAEFTSGGNCDVEETSFRFPTLKDGWNTIYLPVSGAAENAAKLDAINFVRIYFGLNGETTIKVTDIAFGTAVEFKQDADYKAVNDAIDAANAKIALAKNRNITYTYASLKALNDAIGAVEEGLFVNDQEKVDAFAKAINNAADGLKAGVSPWIYYLTVEAYQKGNVSINFDFATFFPFLNHASGMYVRL